MKLGVVAVLFNDLAFEDALDRVRAFGLDAIELGAGNYAGTAHIDPARILDDGAYVSSVLRALESRGLELSALSVHGNPLHPRRDVAESHDRAYRAACLAAERLGVATVNLFSGCPGDRTGSDTPNWVTCPWPPEYLQLWEWQWRDVAIPYWRDAASFAVQHGVRLGIEMHPGMLVYNLETLLRLREAAGEAIGANFDPSHLLWQGVDAIAAARELGRERAIFHVHAKDTHVDRTNVARNGNLDPKPYEQIADRAWTFRSVGYGSGEEFWKALVSELRVAGFDGVLSIEHEDMLASREEGLGRAIEMLKRCILIDPPVEPWWT